MTSLSETSLLAGSSGVSTGYTIDQSIRFNDNDSAFMKKDYSGDGSQTTFTLSGWFKLGVLSSTHCLFATGYLNGTTADFALYMNGDQIYFYGSYDGTNSQANRLETTQLFRDHSAWYHIVFVADTTNIISRERLRLYVNGSRVTAFDTETYPSQNDTLRWGDATYTHAIGASGDDTASLNSQTPRFHYDGYMAEIHYLDGYAYGPEFFGEFKENTDIWIPKEYTGSYGTNGFKIDGRDSSDLGDDESGQGNDFTTSGLASHDQVADSPTNNWSVMNPLNGDGGTTWKNGNLELSTANQGNNASTIFMITGKWYWEAKGYGYAGAVCSVDRGAYNSGITPSDSQSIGYYHTGDFYWGGGSDSTPASYATSDIIGVAVNMDDGNVSFYKNNTLQGTLSFSSTVSSLATDGCYACVNNGTSSSTITFYLNFGQDGTFAGTETAQGNSDGNGVGNFYYTPPSGYLALCTSNLGS